MFSLKATLRPFYPVLLLVVAGGGVVLYFEWEKRMLEWNLGTALRENQELQKAIANLTATETVATADVLQRVENKKGAYVDLVFSETERGNPKKVLRQERLMARGELTYFDALVVSFDDNLVQEGEKNALFLWKGIFGGKEAPEDGYLFNDPSLPEAYGEISNALKVTFLGFTIRDDGKNFWKDIWDLANNPDKLKHLGIHSIQGKASSMKLLEGKRYKLTISNSGKIDIKLEGPSLIIVPTPPKLDVN